MLLGIHIGTFQRPTLEAALDAVKQHGLSCVHFKMTSAGLESKPRQIDDSTCERINRAMRDRGVSIATLSATFNMIHPDLGRRQDGHKRLEVLAAAAHRLDTSLLTICTGTRDPENQWRAHPDNSTPAAWTRISR